MKLNVPYYSQYLDVNDEYWAPRTCGFCCIKMVAEFHGKSVPEIAHLAEIAKAEGGYSEHGIIHDWSVNYFKKLGLQAYREEKMDDNGSPSSIDKLTNFLDSNNPVIVSVARERDGKKLFHQVVLTGYEKYNSNVKYFYMNDSAATFKGEGKEVEIPIEDFLKEWRRMAIFVQKID